MFTKNWAKKGNLVMFKMLYYIKVIPSLAVIFTQWKYQKFYLHSVKITSNCDVISCIPCSVLDLKKTCSNTKGNLRNYKIHCFWCWMCNYFYLWDRIFSYFLSCFTHVKISKFLSHSWNNSIFNIKPLKILYLPLQSSFGWLPF